ncbi:hypothetical protein K523DRAFT_357649 [Schizophyllum commune Tattone D]|nr:hypothetical protein K523DRAFT_357649 [Schizophyllum commune Tattone D]
MRSHSFVTTGDDGAKVYWYYPDPPPRRRPNRGEAQVTYYLRKLFPLPESLGGSRWDYEDASERARFDAIERLRYELEHKVYPACDRSRFTDSEGDDALDPVIDYKELKGKLTCVFTLEHYIPAFDVLDYSWEADAPFNWAPLDAVHATIAQEDVHMQRFLASGGDPKPEPYAGYVDVD